MKTKNELIQNPEICKPHVVLLGAGASRATFENGDASGKKLPVMDNLVDTLDLKPILEEAGIESSGNFEIIYSNIKDDSLKNEIENKIYNYFSDLSLPNTVTIYDRILLSLRNKDAIFTFNWDPFLFDAYKRNVMIIGSDKLPGIFFLHGNVRIGSCESHPNQWGNRGDLCTICHKSYTDVPLLYPIKKKDYFGSNKYTASSWESAKREFADAFTMTIFGYSAPSSDIEAEKLIQAAWLHISEREFEHIEVIDIQDSEEVSRRWRSFAPTFHLNHAVSFEGSCIYKWPRRSCEALFYAMSEGWVSEDFPLSETDNLNELQNYIEKIAEHE